MGSNKFTFAVLAFTFGTSGCFKDLGEDEAGTDTSSTSGDSSDQETGAELGGTDSDSGTDSDAGTDSDTGTDSDDDPGGAVCGNGVIEEGEECDDEDANADSAACLSDCVANVCGDGFVHEGVEECDDGDENGELGCTTICNLQFYSGSTATCSMAGLLMCGYFEAECRVDPMGGGGGELCYWPDPVDETGCDDTPGIWTSTDSGFAQNARHMVFPEPGVCISQYANLECSNSDNNTCLANGATLCFQEKAASGGPSGNPSICWWDVNQAGCANTDGLWSTQDTWGQNHPNTLPPGADACITQVANL